MPPARNCAQTRLNLQTVGPGSRDPGRTCGARQVMAADIDPFALAAIRCNAEINSVNVEATARDLIGGSDDFDVILVGDMCYERPLAERLMAWLKKSRAVILLGDPGRSYFPKSGLTRLATYSVPTTRELEDREIRETGVWRLEPEQG